MEGLQPDSMIPKIYVKNAHHDEGVVNLYQCNEIIADPESDVDLRIYQVTDTVVIPLPCLMGHLLHQTLNLPLFSNANLPSPAFVLDRHRSNVSRHVVGHPTLAISATTGWVQISINGEVICIPILWFALIYGVCPLHPMNDCCTLEADNKIDILRIGFECDHLSIYQNGCSNCEERNT